MLNYPSETSLILVAVIPNIFDMDIAKLLGWYRIPLRSAPKVIDVDYLAFYQTNAFGLDHRWRIETFAEVRGHELVSRAELFKDQLNHPRANEEYFKIQIGPLERLHSPIMAGKWRRITFFYTIGELFNQASSIPDLVVRSDERQILWRSLRERAIEGGKYKEEELPFDSDQLPEEMLLWLSSLGYLSDEIKS